MQNKSMFLTIGKGAEEERGYLPDIFPMVV